MCDLITGEIQKIIINIITSASSLQFPQNGKIILQKET